MWEARFLLLLCQLQLVVSLTKLRPAPNVSANSSAALTLEALPFHNILLVVHCRLKKGIGSEVCAEREPLFDGYRQFFADVLYITRKECPTCGDPHMCVTKLMEGPGANRDGVFYMHFDSLIRPRQLAATFNKDDMFSFDNRTWCEINETSLGQEHCICGFWNPNRAKAYQDGINKLIGSGIPEFANLDPWQFWIGNDDMFYVPRKLYHLYGALARSLKGTHHEIAGPTIRTILSNVTAVPNELLGCIGSCCSKLRGEIALLPNFKCGHAFDLSVEQTRDDFPTAITTHRRLPMESWRKIVREAME
mmetsp:Transcript_2304/g.5275  ORF Transcript_2304/g.5275 Transcript_2304/m.5275 type:complete len:306 (+) Transcript_2304:77-994(+)